MKVVFENSSSIG